MSPSDVAAEHEASPVTTSAAQARIITAALDLFARHGVGGTSLQMIADGEIEDAKTIIGLILAAPRLGASEFEPSYPAV